ncbi:MAG: biopolymer transporter ExbD [Nodosilinea sp. LVE1205-7]|jgi:biopolymer transport protein ExbD
MRAPREDSDPPLEVKIIPMIDVLFSILTFFIMSTLFLTRSESLPVNLPKAETAKTQPQTKIAITITPDLALALNKQPIQLEQVDVGVRSLISKSQSAVVVIYADETVPYGQVIAVMDRIKRVRGAKIAVATRQP